MTNKAHHDRSCTLPSPAEHNTQVFPTGKTEHQVFKPAGLVAQLLRCAVADRDTGRLALPSPPVPATVRPRRCTPTYAGSLTRFTGSSPPDYLHPKGSRWDS